MIYVISKATFGEYGVRDIQCNANWCSCPYSDYALIPDSMVDGILATQGYCDITLNEAGTEVLSYTARSIPSVPEECCGTNTVLSVNGVKAETDGDVTLTPDSIGAAPSGFGLGSMSPQSVVDLNACLRNGWYYTSEETLNVSHSYFRYAAVHVTARTSQHIAQRLISVGDSQKYEMLRYTMDGGETWVEEWVNPPMGVGIEYRTTERFRGKPVYVQLVDVGTLPNNSENSFNLLVNESIYIADIVEITGIYSQTSSMFTNHTEYRPLEKLDGVDCYIQTDDVNGYVWLQVKTNKNLSNCTAVVKVKYTKV